MGILLHVVMNFLLLILAVMGYNNIHGEKSIVLISLKKYFYITLFINLLILIFSFLLDLY